MRHDAQARPRRCAAPPPARSRPARRAPRRASSVRSARCRPRRGRGGRSRAGSRALARRPPSAYRRSAECISRRRVSRQRVEGEGADLLVREGHVPLAGAAGLGHQAGGDRRLEQLRWLRRSRRRRFRPSWCAARTRRTPEGAPKHGARGQQVPRFRLSDAARRWIRVRTADGTSRSALRARPPCAADGLQQASLAISARQLLDDERHALCLGVDRGLAVAGVARHRGRY